MTPRRRRRRQRRRIDFGRRRRFVSAQRRRRRGQRNGRFRVLRVRFKSFGPGAAAFHDAGTAGVECGGRQRRRRPVSLRHDVIGRRIPRQIVPGRSGGGGGGCRLLPFASPTAEERGEEGAPSVPRLLAPNPEAASRADDEQHEDAEEKDARRRDRNFQGRAGRRIRRGWIVDVFGGRYWGIDMIVLREGRAYESGRRGRREFVSVRSSRQRGRVSPSVNAVIPQIAAAL